jgi:enoyl-CoA hydratase/carnithine racemase
MKIAMTASYRTITFSDKDAPVARITLNQPDKRNPISPLVAGELAHALEAVAERDDLVAVVLTGAGKVFSAGGDLSQMGGGGAGEGEVSPISLVELLGRMHALGKPIIAMVNGHALAGGLGLMVACDLVVASDKATFGTTEIRLGLWPMMITAEIVRNIGRKKSLELMLTGKRIDAAEAERIGLINRAVAHAELEAETMALARDVAGKSPATLRLGLRSFYDTQDMDFEPALRHLEGELGKVLALEDAREGIAAFFGKRDPVWKGR